MKMNKQNNNNNSNNNTNTTNEVNVLPPICYSILQSTGEIILLKVNESGYFKTNLSTDSREINESLVQIKNNELGINSEQEKLMSLGSLYGWHIPIIKDYFNGIHSLR